MKELIGKIRSAGFDIRLLDGDMDSRFGFDYFVFGVPGGSVNDREYTSRLRDFCKSDDVRKIADKLSVRVTWQTARALVIRKDNRTFPSDWQESVVRAIKLQDGCNDDAEIVEDVENAADIIKTALLAASKSNIRNGCTMSAIAMSHLTEALEHLRLAVEEEDN